MATPLLDVFAKVTHLSDKRGSPLNDRDVRLRDAHRQTAQLAPSYLVIGWPERPGPELWWRIRRGPRPSPSLAPITAAGTPARRCPRPEEIRSLDSDRGCDEAEGGQSL